MRGSATVPVGLCAGTETGLAAVNLLGIVPADQQGRILLDAHLPPFICNLHVQAVDLMSCAKSNVATFP